MSEGKVADRCGVFSSPHNLIEFEGDFPDCWGWLQDRAPDGGYSIRCSPWLDLGCLKTSGRVVPDEIYTRMQTVLVAARGLDNSQVAGAARALMPL